MINSILPILRKGLLLALGVIPLSISLSVGQEISPFKQGDRVVFLGNSITDGGHYHSFIWLYYMTRFPDMNLQIFNAGIGGDRVQEMTRRLDGDVFAKNPSFIVATFGMNDTGYFEYNGDDAENFADQKVQESFEGYQEMEKRFQGLQGTKILLLGSTPYDEYADLPDNVSLKNKNKAMERVVDFQRASAQENGWEFYDYNQSISEINREQQQKDPSFTLSGNDRVHPDNNGHMVMTYLFLKAQGFAGKKVAEVDIDSQSKQASRLENCQVENIQVSSGSLSFDYLAEALPYPLDTTARGWGSQHSQYEATKVVPFMDEMNQEVLKVSGLNGEYELRIDQEYIGTWTAADLAQGINLAEYTQTPQYQQALKVMYLNEERWEIERRFRDLAWVEFNFFGPKGLLFADNRKAIEVMDEHVETDGWLRAKRDLYAKAMHPEIRQAWQDEMDLLVSTIQKVNKPINRHFTLTKVGR